MRADQAPRTFLSQNKSRLEHLERFNTRHPKRGDSCSGDCFLHCCLTSFIGLGWVLQVRVDAFLVVVGLKLELALKLNLPTRRNRSGPEETFEITTESKE